MSSTNIKKKRKAIYATVFIFPGAGHWILGRRLLAAGIVAAILAALGVMAVRIFFLVNDVVFGGGNINAMTINAKAIEEVHTKAYSENWHLLLAIIVVWVLSIIDAIKLDRKAREVEKTAEE